MADYYLSPKITDTCGAESDIKLQIYNNNFIYYSPTAQYEALQPSSGFPKG